MSATERPDIEAIRQRAEAATPGPWAWRGNDRHPSLNLMGRDPEWGVTTVMAFRRWGMQQAQPAFRVAGLLHDAKRLFVYEVCPDCTDPKDPRVYRGHIVGVRHPDAQFVAAARQDIDDLLAYIAHLENPNGN